MGSLQDEVVQWASTATDYEQIGLLKRLLGVVGEECLNKVRSELAHARRGHFKGSKRKSGSAPVPPTSVPSPTDVVLSPRVGGLQPLPEVRVGWWTNWFGESGDPSILCIDIEAVGVPKMEKNRCVTIITNQGHVIKKTKDRSPLSYKMLAAKYHICNFLGNTILSGVIKHEPGSYVVNKHTLAVNGITYNALKNGESFDAIKLKIIELFSNNLIIGCGLASDFEYLDLKYNDERFATFDIQKEYKGPVTNDEYSTQVYPHKLNDIYQFSFGESIQSGVHSAEMDAVGTMRIFREKYIPDKLASARPDTQAAMKLYDDIQRTRKKN